MKYKGIELTPITTPQLFDPPKDMLLWDSDDDTPIVGKVWCIAPPVVYNQYRVLSSLGSYLHCAEIPQQKRKRATKLQLMEWVAKGNGMWKFKDIKNMNQLCFAHVSCFEDDFHKCVDDDVLILPFGTTEWLEPTLENMGMEDAK